MEEKLRWETCRAECKETNRDVTLMVQWRDMGEGEALKGISCDNPQLGYLEEWDCRWSCWEAISQKKGNR